MVKFRQKQFTIPEGHYTGPKDMDGVPGFIEIVGKSAGIGAGIGAIAGGIMKDYDAKTGALTGGKYGTIAGILLKFFINYLHNPMSSVKYQEVDKKIRTEFGIYRASGITIGDSIDNRNSLDEKFSFNDRNITNYKINIAIQDGSITMYTFGMTDKELTETSKVLDYYCKKYFGMDYSSSLINKKYNSYSVNLIFTNYSVIVEYLMELSKKLQTKINILDNKVIVSNRINSEIWNRENPVDDNEIKINSPKISYFSDLKELNKYDLINILGSSGNYSVLTSRNRHGVKDSSSFSLIGILIHSLEKLSSNEIARTGNISGTGVTLSNLRNIYLEETLKRIGKYPGFDFTSGELGVNNNISMTSGVFIITVIKDSKESKTIDDRFFNKFNKIVNRTDTGNVIVYTYFHRSEREFKIILKTLMNLGIKFNIFEK